MTQEVGHARRAATPRVRGDHVQGARLAGLRMMYGRRHGVPGTSSLKLSKLRTPVLSFRCPPTAGSVCGVQARAGGQRPAVPHVHRLHAGDNRVGGGLEGGRGLHTRAGGRDWRGALTTAHSCVRRIHAFAAGLAVFFVVADEHLSCPQRMALPASGCWWHSALQPPRPTLSGTRPCRVLCCGCVWTGTSRSCSWQKTTTR